MMKFFAAALALGVLPASAATTIAVLPLFNAEDAPAYNWIGESVAETVRESLLSANFLVLSREDREEVYKRLSVRAGVMLTKASVLKIGETLDAGLVVYGSFRVEARPGRKAEMTAPLRIALHTIDLKTMRPGKDLEHTGTLADLSLMQSHLAWMLLKQLAPESTPAEELYLRSRKVVRLNAMESYVRGLMAVTPQSRIKFFSQAVKLDDHFSQAEFQLGRLEFQDKDYKKAAEWLGKVSKTDFHYMEASFLLAICRIYSGDYDSAIQLLKIVLAELPLNEVYNNLGVAQTRKNESGAVGSFQKAIEGDQGDPDYWFNAGYALWKFGQYAAAADRFRAVLDRSAGDSEATIMLGRCLRSDGPRGNELRSGGRERIKTTFEDSAFRQLQAELRADKKEEKK
jgi:tetratricopeptide (TPR) repeat protein